MLGRSGNDDWGQEKGRCHWGPGYQTRLVEMLGKWKVLIEDETWRVGEQGVVGDWR